MGKVWYLTHKYFLIFGFDPPDLPIEKIKKCMGDRDADVENEVLKMEQNLQVRTFLYMCTATVLIHDRKVLKNGTFVLVHCAYLVLGLSELDWIMSFTNLHELSHLLLSF